MFDITKHKWSDENTSLCDTFPDDSPPSLDLCYCRQYWEPVNINKDDAIAIARHFGLIKEERNDYTLLWKEQFKRLKMANIPQSETTYLNSSKANKERLEESIKQLERGDTIDPQWPRSGHPDNTYKSLNLDNVDMQESELFDKRSDSHG